jgi:hypothetical protein
MNNPTNINENVLTFFETTKTFDQKLIETKNLEERIFKLLDFCKEAITNLDILQLKDKEIKTLQDEKNILVTEHNKTVGDLQTQLTNMTNVNTQNTNAISIISEELLSKFNSTDEYLKKNSDYVEPDIITDLVDLPKELIRDDTLPIEQQSLKVTSNILKFLKNTIEKQTSRVKQNVETIKNMTTSQNANINLIKQFVEYVFDELQLRLDIIINDKTVKNDIQNRFQTKFDELKAKLKVDHIDWDTLLISISNFAKELDECRQDIFNGKIKTFIIDGLQKRLDILLTDKTLGDEVREDLQTKFDDLTIKLGFNPIDWDDVLKNISELAHELDTRTRSGFKDRIETLESLERDSFETFKSARTQSIRSIESYAKIVGLLDEKANPIPGYDQYELSKKFMDKYQKLQQEFF